MKKTGMIRRIDELGRIVIPKEMRNSLRIKEGDTLEIYIDNLENIVLKKYSLLYKFEDFSQEFVDSIYSLIKKNVLITDKNKIIAYAGKEKRDYLNKEISEEIITKINRREEMLEKYIKDFKIVNDKIITGTYAVSTIIVNSDAVGIVIIYSINEKIGDLELKICQIVSNFLNKYLEN